MNTCLLIAVAGGIGSGKSVVSEILRIMGYPVYDCDQRAKDIMNGDKQIHSALCRDIHPNAVVNGTIDRQLISNIVFADSGALQRLNRIVHGAVKKDLCEWRKQIEFQGHKVAFVETAILRQSGLVDFIDRIWEVTAPIETRIARVMARNSVNRQQVLARIESQRNEDLSDIEHDIINNSDDAALLPQVHRLIEYL